MLARFKPASRRVRAVIAASALVVSTVSALVVAGAPAVADTAPPSGTPATVSADALPTVQQNGVVWAEVTVGNTVYATGSFSQTWPADAAKTSANDDTARQPARVRHHVPATSSPLQPQAERPGPGGRRVAGRHARLRRRATSRPSTGHHSQPHRRFRHRYRRARHRLRRHHSDQGRCRRRHQLHGLRRRNFFTAQRRQPDPAGRLQRQQRRACSAGHPPPTTTSSAPWCWRRTESASSSAAGSPRSTASDVYGLGAVDATDRRHRCRSR